MKNPICLSPYKELDDGWTESIYDHIDPNFNVDNQVIMYLKAGCVSIGSFGVYTHPFEPEKNYARTCFSYR